MQTPSIQYEEPIYCDPSFPIGFHEDAMSPNRPMIYTHWHVGVEILYFHEGTGHLLTRTQRIHFGPGTILVIGTNMLHTLCAESPHCKYHCLMVEPRFLMANGIAPDVAYPSYGVVDKEANAVMDRIVDEFQETRPLYKAMVLGHILQLAAILFRNHGEVFAGEDKDRDPALARRHDAVQEALKYIRENLSDHITLEYLCDHVGMSKYYFCRLFRDLTGLPPLQYINMVRCDRARHLITEGQMNITQAAQTVGVENASYFSRMYKKYIGVLPSDDAQKKDKRDRKGEVIGVLKTLR